MLYKRCINVKSANPLKMTYCKDFGMDLNINKGSICQQMAGDKWYKMLPKVLTFVN